MSFVIEEVVRMKVGKKKGNEWWTELIEKVVKELRENASKIYVRANNSYKGKNVWNVKSEQHM